MERKREGARSSGYSGEKGPGTDSKKPHRYELIHSRIALVFVSLFLSLASLIFEFKVVLCSNTPPFSCVTQGKRRKSDESMTFLSALPLDVPLQKRSRDSLFGGVFTKENVPL